MRSASAPLRDGHGQPAHRFTATVPLGASSTSRARVSRATPRSSASAATASRSVVRWMDGVGLARGVEEAARRQSGAAGRPAATTCGTGERCACRGAIVVVEGRERCHASRAVFSRATSCSWRERATGDGDRGARAAAVPTPGKTRIAIRRAAASSAGGTATPLLECALGGLEQRRLASARSSIAPAAARSPARYWSTAVCHACSGGAGGLAAGDSRSASTRSSTSTDQATRRDQSGAHVRPPSSGCRCAHPCPVLSPLG